MMTFAALGKLIYKRRPKGSTGVYITSTMVMYGYRTNPKKYPSNWVPFDKLTSSEREKI